MARDLDWPVEIVAVPTVREPDGLALSSRNVYLAPEQREQAASLHRALIAIDPALVEGELDYLDVVDPDTFTPCPPQAGALVIGAARFGGTRLIDNVELEAP
jgi:pantoate--beta-alanine ligase